MKITDTYRKNIEEIEKFLHTMSYDEESEKRIRQYINDPLSVVNDDIKALFRKYDDEIVDYRIPTGKMMEGTILNGLTKEYTAVLAMLVEALKQKNEISFNVNVDGSISSNLVLSMESIKQNYFTINGNKRKIWRYLDGVSKEVANIYIDNPDRGNAKQEFNKDFYMTYCILYEYYNSLNGRTTSLSEKINTWNEEFREIRDFGNFETKFENFYKSTVKILSEVIGAKMIDSSKFKMYLSFNAFDWLLASTSETWHSCIDMNSQYCYGLGILGMCGCPDWGMFIYTNGDEKECLGVKSLHIVSRSWACFTSENRWQLINWYPKNLGVNVNLNAYADIPLIAPTNCPWDSRSKSSWKPLTFCNGEVAWIYADRNEFKIDTNNTVYFILGSCMGLPKLGWEDGRLCWGANHNMIDTLRDGYSSIVHAVQNEVRIADLHPDSWEESRYHCGYCGSSVDSDEDLTWIESEEIYVCQGCLEDHYFWCDECEEYHHDDDAMNIWFGDKSWNYRVICRGCLESGDYIYDEYAEKYYDPNDVQIIDVDDNEFSIYSINRMLELDENNDYKVYMWSDNTYHFYPEEKESV